MKFRFSGNPNGKDRANSIVAFGYEFRDGAAVDVDEATAEKLALNSHFEAVVGEDSPVERRKPGRPRKVDHADENET